MGLGLALVQVFAELHGAQFDLTSAEGKGTTVTVTFPENRTVLREGTESAAITPLRRVTAVRAKAS
jgi:K+-sensing histidine kinase KdpD